jgi:hypothetical protein
LIVVVELLPAAILGNKGVLVVAALCGVGFLIGPGVTNSQGGHVAMVIAKEGTVSPILTFCLLLDLCG